MTVPVSAFSQVKVIGQVTTPQSLPYREGMRVLDAVLATRRSRAVRGRQSRQDRAHAWMARKSRLRVKIANLVNKGDMAQNLELRPGDVLVIPESRF